MHKLLAFPPQTRLYVCHDYPPQGREARCQTTVAEQRAGNIHVHDGVDEAAFVQMRTQRECRAGDADTAAAGDPGECAGGESAAARREWGGVPEDPAQSALNALNRPPASRVHAMEN